MQWGECLERLPQSFRKKLHQRRRSMEGVSHFVKEAGRERDLSVYAAHSEKGLALEIFNMGVVGVVAAGRAHEAISADAAKGLI